MNWLITGGCGFIGTSLIRNLLSENATNGAGHAIRVIDNLSVGTRADLGHVCDFSELDPDSLGTAPEGVELVVGDIIDEHLANRVTRGVDVIVHLAANTGVGPSVDDPRADCLANVIGTFNYLDAARLNGVKRFVFASSGAPVGEVEPPIHEELPAHPVSPYGASKLAGEGYCSAYYRTFGIDTVALRFGNIYGPGSGHKNSVVAKFIKHALAGELLEVYGSGDQTRDFIYIDDMVDAILRAATVPGVGGEVFQIATARETTVNELLQLMDDTFRKHAMVMPAVIHGEARLGDVKRNYSDTTKSERMLNWRITTELSEGLERTLAWFLANCEGRLEG